MTVLTENKKIRSELIQKLEFIRTDDEYVSTKMSSYSKNSIDRLIEYCTRSDNFSLTHTRQGKYKPFLNRLKEETKEVIAGIEYNYLNFHNGDKKNMDITMLDRIKTKIEHPVFLSRYYWSKQDNEDISSIVKYIDIFTDQLKSNSTEELVKIIFQDLRILKFLIIDTYNVINTYNFSSQINSSGIIKFSDNTTQNRIDSLNYKLKEFELCKYCYRVSAGNEVCELHKTSLYNGNKNYIMARKVFSSLESEEEERCRELKEVLEEYKWQRKTVGFQEFQLIGANTPFDKVIGTSFQADEATIEIVNSLLYGDWNDVGKPILLAIVDSLDHLREALRPIVLNSVSLEVATMQLYSESNLHNTYEVSLHPYWLLYALKIENLAFQVANASKLQRSERDKRYYTKYTEQNMTYIDIVKSEISEGYLVLKPNQTHKSKASNIRERIKRYKNTLKM